MTAKSPNRRDVLKGAAAAAAALVGPAVARPAFAQGAGARARIDAVLRQAVDTREVPGVVAMAATDKACSTRVPSACARSARARR
jgi:hypothetical protein